MQLVLASASKFKKEILDKVGLKHIQLASNFKEISSHFDDVYQYVQDLALGKADDVCQYVSKGIVLGLDTVVYANHKILEKPKSLEEVRLSIQSCSNNTVSIITGIALINKESGKIITDYAETKVTFRKINEIDIEYYIEHEPDLMYVSGFVIETYLSNYIDQIVGSYYNILGVPVEKIYSYLCDWQIYLKDLIVKDISQIDLEHSFFSLYQQIKFRFYYKKWS